MALTSNGLTDIGMGAGFTTNFHVQYEDTLSTTANAINNANALLAAIENEFNVLTGWFNTPNGKFGTGNRITVNLDKPDGSGANNFGYSTGGNSLINLDAQAGNSNAANAAEIVKMLFVAEFVEVLMDLTGTWNRGDSNGEGLSQYCTIERFQTGHYLYYNSWVDNWLNQHPRQDWVNNTEGTDGNSISFGCSLAFLYYLNKQLNFSINQIIAAGASKLSTIYSTLTGDPGDPFPFFTGLLEHEFPSSATASIPGPVFDNPYPLGELSFWVDKSTFGKDEVQDVIASNGGTFPEAFWLVVEGFSEDSFNALGVTIPAPTGSFANITGVTIARSAAAIDFENAANSKAPQRIRVAYDITFNNASLVAFPGPGGSAIERELDAFLTVSGNQVPGSGAATVFELVAGADPYFTNIDPTQDNVFYLSQDLRVFTATPGKNNIPVSGGPAFASDNITGAFTYIQSLLSYLNTNFNNPNGPDPFSTILPGQAGALTGDSSVTPLTIDISYFPPSINVYSNYNFAVARVRLRGASGPAGAAQNVRVFFRLWSTETADTDYQVASTYPSSLDSNNLPGSPLVGADHHTLPFFATGNLSGNTDYTSGVNIRTIQIPSGDSVWAYYGCFLNLYDTSNQIDGQPVQAWLNGTHHCIVAQIAYDGAPIVNSNGITMNPENSDKLAQRNLQITLSDNPGPADTHRIPQTFDIRPSAQLVEKAGIFLSYPDELMIDWGKIPAGSTASIYWPQVNAADVLALATRLYGSHTLFAADANTIQCKVTGGVTYVPIPPGTGDNFAGLFTVDLPQTVVTGQEFDIVVRRIATRANPEFKIQTASQPSTVGAPGKTAKVRKPPEGAVIEAQRRPPQNWRYVVGTFQVKIPVSTKEVMLLPEENTLAIMKWRLGLMAPSNRWYPVLQRYISYIAARVDGLGGDSTSIQPSPNGVPVKEPGKPTEREYTGKVCEVLYDCFGDFEGFVLCDCCEQHGFVTRKRGIEKIALRALKEQLTVSVFVDCGDERTIFRLKIKG